MSIRIVVADDHEVVRTGLAKLFAGTDIQIVGVANDGEQAVAQTLQHKPDVVVMDIRMPNVDGLTALETIRDKMPEMAVVMYTAYENPTYIARAVALGANDFILKTESAEALVDAIHRAAKGEEAPEESAMRNIKRVMKKRHDRGNDGIPLTNRELQVLRHVALGLSNREIGSSLGISIETVKEHVQNILRKLDVSDRTQAAVWAVRRSVV
jgi:DNA-binding NarL/FixJ family response regulator